MPKESVNLVVYPESTRDHDELPKGSLAVMFRASGPAIAGLIETLIGDGRLTLDRVVASARAAGMCALVREAPRYPRTLGRSATWGALFVSEDGAERWWVQPHGQVCAATPAAFAAASKEVG